MLDGELVVDLELLGVLKVELIALAAQGALGTLIEDHLAGQRAGDARVGRLSADFLEVGAAARALHEVRRGVALGDLTRPVELGRVFRRGRARAVVRAAGEEERTHEEWGTVNLESFR